MEANAYSLLGPPGGAAQLEAFNFRSVHNDGWNWRKYGEKTIIGNPFPRSYYKCAAYEKCKCPAKKIMDIADDGTVLYVEYKGHHSHPSRQHLREVEGYMHPYQLGSPPPDMASAAAGSASAGLSIPPLGSPFPPFPLLPGGMGLGLNFGMEHSMDGSTVAGLPNSQADILNSMQSLMTAAGMNGASNSLLSPPSAAAAAPASSAAQSGGPVSSFPTNFTSLLRSSTPEATGGKTPVRSADPAEASVTDPVSSTAGNMLAAMSSDSTLTDRSAGIATQPASSGAGAAPPDATPTSGSAKQPHTNGFATAGMDVRAREGVEDALPPEAPFSWPAGCRKRRKHHHAGPGGLGDKASSTLAALGITSPCAPRESPGAGAGGDASRGACASDVTAAQANGVLSPPIVVLQQDDAGHKDAPQDNNTHACPASAPDSCRLHPAGDEDAAAAPADGDAPASTAPPQSADGSGNGDAGMGDAVLQINQGGDAAVEPGMLVVPVMSCLQDGAAGAVAAAAPLSQAAAAHAFTQLLLKATGIQGPLGHKEPCPMYGAMLAEHGCAGALSAPPASPHARSDGVGPRPSQGAGPGGWDAAGSSSTSPFPPMAAASHLERCAGDARERDEEVASLPLPAHGVARGQDVSSHGSHGSGSANPAALPEAAGMLRPTLSDSYRLLSCQYPSAESARAGAVAPGSRAQQFSAPMDALAPGDGDEQDQGQARSEVNSDTESMPLAAEVLAGMRDQLCSSSAAAAGPPGQSFAIHPAKRVKMEPVMDGCIGPGPMVHGHDGPGSAVFMPPPSTLPGGPHAVPSCAAAHRVLHVGAPMTVPLLQEAIYGASWAFTNLLRCCGDAARQSNMPISLPSSNSGKGKAARRMGNQQHMLAALQHERERVKEAYARLFDVLRLVMEGLNNIVSTMQQRQHNLPTGSTADSSPHPCAARPLSTADMQAKAFATALPDLRVGPLDGAQARLVMHAAGCLQEWSSGVVAGWYPGGVSDVLPAAHLLWREMQAKLPAFLESTS